MHFATTKKLKRGEKLEGKDREGEKKDWERIDVEEKDAKRERDRI